MDEGMFVFYMVKQKTEVYVSSCLVVWERCRGVGCVYVCVCVCVCVCVVFHIHLSLPVLLSVYIWVVLLPVLHIQYILLLTNSLLYLLHIMYKILIQNPLLYCHYHLPYLSSHPLLYQNHDN